mgnify:CR=1 FL=1
MESAKKFLPLTNQLGTFSPKRQNYFLAPPLYRTQKSILNETFLSPTNQLGTFFSKRRNYFFILSSGRHREGPKVELFSRKF